MRSEHTRASTRTDDDTRRILSNARAAETERLRNIALRENPDLAGDDLAARIRELELDKLRAAGKAGRAAQQHRSDVGAQFITAYPTLLGRLIDLIDYVNALDPTPAPVATVDPEDDPAVAA